MIRTLALGAVMAAGVATGALAQGVNNTGYSRGYYGDPGYGAYYGGPGYGRYYGPGDRGYSGNIAGAVLPPYGDRYDYYGNNYGYGSSYQPGWGSGYGTSEQRGWGSGGGAAYDRGYNRPYNYGYWSR